MHLLQFLSVWGSKNADVGQKKYTFLCTLNHHGIAELFVSFLAQKSEPRLCADSPYIPSASSCTVGFAPSMNQVSSAPHPSFPSFPSFLSFPHHNPQLLMECSRTGNEEEEGRIMSLIFVLLFCASVSGWCDVVCSIVLVGS